MDQKILKENLEQNGFAYHYRVQCSNPFCRRFVNIYSKTPIRMVQGKCPYCGMPQSFYVVKRRKRR